MSQWRVVDLKQRKWARSLCWGGDCLWAQDCIIPGYGEAPDLACTHCRLNLRMPKRKCRHYTETKYVLAQGGGDGGIEEMP